MMKERLERPPILCEFALPPQASVLDIGCGESGDFPLLPPCQIVGIDVNAEVIARAAQNYPARYFLVASAEHLPFANGSFQGAVAKLSLPYTDVPVALEEVARVLDNSAPFWMRLHAWQFTVQEFCNALPRPASLYRLYVLLNGLYFHFTGRVLGIRGRFESFQTERGIRKALSRAGFGRIEFQRSEGRFVVTCSKG